MGQTEILAPAGSLESLYGALKLGADAVYVGVSRFGARAFANNPSVDELLEALLYAHLRDKKIYLTVNTLLHDRELEDELFPLIKPLYEAGLDACIVQDLGVLSFLHENFPEMDLHASTQMTLFSGDEANLLKPFGVTRYVPARELTIEEIREARGQTDLEIEVFVHGALCYSYSGQCLMSEVIGGRSGNRGMCAGPCRLPYCTEYGSGYWLNTKDICTLMRIPELLEAGIDSFKIEGRMKKPEYSALTASLYRKYVTLCEEKGKDAFYRLVEDTGSELWEDYKKCQDLYNRGGFSEGYLFEKDKKQIVYPKKNGHFGVRVGTVQNATSTDVTFLADEDLHPQDVLEFREKDDTPAYEYTTGEAVKKGEMVTAHIKFGSHMFPGQHVYRRKNAALLDSVLRRIEDGDDRYPLEGTFVGRIGEPAVFTVYGGGVEAEASGDILQKADNQPVTREKIRKNLSATGNTDYVFRKIDIDVPEHIFLPAGGIKRLRREAIANWEAKAKVRRQAGVKHSLGPVSQKPESDDNWIAFASLEQISTAVEYCEKKTLFILKLTELLPEQWETAVEYLAGRPFALEFPKVLRGPGRMEFETMWNLYGSVFDRLRPEAVLVNSYRGLLYARQYFRGLTWYADENMYANNRRARLAWQALGMIPARKKNYGRMAVMESEGCVAGAVDACKKAARVALSGPKGDEFVAVSHCRFGWSTIYTKDPVSVWQERAVRIDFTWETREEVRKVIREWNL